MRRVSFNLLASLLAASVGSLLAGPVAAQDNIKIGLVMPLTGVLNQVGRQAVAGARLYLDQHGDTVAGRKIELIVRDDGSIPDNAKRIAQELITNGKVAILGGGLTPSVLAMAPLATASKTPTVVMVSGTSVVTERSPYFVRTSWTHAQQASVLANWAARNGSKRVTIISSDWAPGHEAAGVFTANFTQAGGEIVETLKVPLVNPDFAPFLQRARDHAPDTLFVFVPASQAAVLSKQFVERGLDKSGIRLIGPGDITDDEELPGMSDAMMGTITAGFYSPGSSDRHQPRLSGRLPQGQPAAGAELHQRQRLRRHAPDLRGPEEDWRQRRWRYADCRDEGHELGEPARSDVDRSGNARRGAQHLHPPRREDRRDLDQPRIRDVCRGRRPNQAGDQMRVLLLSR